MSGQSPTLLESLTDILNQPVPEAILDRSVLHVLDWTGCAVAGGISEQARILRRLERRGPCHVMYGGNTSEDIAALINGSVGNILEMDDVHREAILHPGPVVIPAALAVAEATRASADTLLAGIVRGYEAMIRIGRATGPGHYRFWHNTATCGPFGAAAAVASIMGLSKQQTVSALANAGTQAGGLWQMRHENVMTKQLHAGRAAQSGVVASRLAAEGFTGPASLLEGEQGFFAALCPDGSPEEVIKPEKGWLLHEVSFKPWPACRHAHPVIDAALELRQLVLQSGIKKVIIRTYRDAVKFCDRLHPQTVTEAKFSLQHSTAVCLLRGEPCLADFEQDVFDQQKFQELREKMVVEENAKYSDVFPKRYGAEIEIDTESGEKFHAEIRDAWGDPDNPVSDRFLSNKALSLIVWSGMEDANNLVEACKKLRNSNGLSDYLRAWPKEEL